MKKRKMKYDIPITSPEHAAFCRKEAARRYGGRLIVDSVGMLLVEDGTGERHTDGVLRALSFFNRDPESAVQGIMKPTAAEVDLWVIQMREDYAKGLLPQWKVKELESLPEWTWVAPPTEGAK